MKAKAKSDDHGGHKGTRRKTTAALTDDHDLQHRFGHLKIDAAIVVHLDGGRNIKLGERNLFCGLLIEHPEHAAGDGVISHFFDMPIAEDQRGFGLLHRLRLIARFDAGLQTVDLSTQPLHVTLQVIILGIGWRLIGGIGILIIIIALRVISERIVVPAVKTVGIISRVSVIGIRAAPAIKASIVVVGVAGAISTAAAIEAPSAKTTGMETAGVETA